MHHGKVIIAANCFYAQGLSTIKNFKSIAYLDQQLFNGTILDNLVCEIHINHVVITIMVPIDFCYEVLSVFKVSSLYQLWLVRSTASCEFKTNLLEGLSQLTI